MSRPLRAQLLVPALGTRLRPLILHTPKCLVLIGPPAGLLVAPAGGGGLRSGLGEHPLWAEQVEADLESWQSPSMDVRTVHEPELLGTASTLLLN